MQAMNSIILSEDTGGKGRQFRARFLQSGLVKYSFGVCLLTKDVINKFIDTFIGCPVIIDHSDVTDENAKDKRVGVISRVEFNDNDGWFWCEGILFDDKAIELINNGYNVSCQYEITEYAENTEGKLHNGIPYDKVILNGKFEHLAIVDNPRYEGAMIAVNAIMATNDKWITIKPHGKDSDDYRRLKLEDGESPQDAMHRMGWYEKRQAGDEKQEASTAEQDKNPVQTKRETYRNAIKEYKEKNAELAKENDMLKRFKLASELTKKKTAITKARKDYAESIMENFKPIDDNSYEEKLEARRERYKDLSTRAQKQSDEYSQHSRDMISAIPMGQPIHGESDRRYREKAWDKLGKSVKYSQKADYYSNKAESVGRAGISSDDKNAIAKLAEKYKNNSTSAERRRIIDRVIDLYQRGDKPTKEKSEHGFTIERNSDINRLQLKFEGRPEKEIIQKLKSNGFRWSPKEQAWQRQLGGNSEYALKRLQKDLESNKAKNNIDIIPILDYIENYDERNDTMNEETKNVFERLIGALKAKNEADKKAENENVDKRDIIRQIMAIAGKDEASEDVKTIAKLAEKLAYDKSEDGTADNKAKNEEEKKEDDKKADNKCAKNEDVDKRKLIDEVGGILKGKVDDEIIRTIIEKLEEVAYDKSETGTADNKAKNEDDEYKKLEDEVEKKAGNKAKNSMDALKDLFFTGEVKSEKTYKTQAERIALGKKLF